MRHHLLPTRVERCKSQGLQGNRAPDCRYEKEVSEERGQVPGLVSFSLVLLFSSLFSLFSLFCPWPPVSLSFLLHFWLRGVERCFEQTFSYHSAGEIGKTCQARVQKKNLLERTLALMDWAAIWSFPLAFHSTVSLPVIPKIPLLSSMTSIVFSSSLFLLLPILFYSLVEGYENRTPHPRPIS